MSHLMHKFELDVMEPHIKALPHKKAYVEIGGWTGGSITWFGELMDVGATLISVEVEPRLELKNAIAALVEKGYDAHLVPMPSQTPAAKDMVTELLKGRAVDCLLIDGNHHLPNVAVDCSRFSGMIRPGGLVVFHDCGCCSVKGMPPDRLGINAVWRYLATNRRSLLVQAHMGTGLVWL